ncbi:MAG: hypothetical protein ABI333_08295 [bacterium]
MTPTTVKPRPSTPTTPFPPIPSRIPSVTFDRVARMIRLGCDMQLHCVISLDSRIDEARLARAVRLLLDAEPVLGCRFVETRFHPRWERREDLDRLPLVTMVESTQPLVDCVPFMIMPCVAERDPMVLVRIYRGKTDTLVLKINHFAVDGGGSKEAAYLLGSLFGALEKDPEYQPRPNLSGRRSLSQLSERFGTLDKLRFFGEGIRHTVARFVPPVSWRVPNREPKGVGARAPGQSYVFHHIGPEGFRKGKELAGRHGATLNDLLVAAFCQACLELEPARETDPLRLRITADLRRYLPTGRAEALCNLSGFVYLDLGKGVPRTFVELLGRVRDEMKRQKAGPIGLGDTALIGPLATYVPASFLLSRFERGVARGVPSDLRAPCLTNIGRIDPAQLRFDGVRVTDAFTTATVIYPPILAVAATGFGESITLSAGFCESFLARTDVERIFARMAERMTA